ncbi:Chs5p-Arf1p-binding proteins-domain-containing protein [Gaertneriomyces semiglobifer]|nr:Chs5p-Arf1p-binding proteins-domain-containing protein [Gaertneriomyces semiglobifer]
MVAADPSVLRGIPEFFENELGESLSSRTESLATFRELGPPDLCHIIKTNSKSQAKDIGSYHYVLGTDASSSGPLAAYLNSLTYSLGSGATKSPWKIRCGTYCCFNAFSRVDMRVEVRIPGGVEAYAVDVRGDKYPIENSSMWEEAHVSAVLRAILDDNDEPDGNDGQPLLGLRKVDPLPTLAAEKRFLEAAAGQFWKGWQLGTEPELQHATFFNNHLTNGLVKYFTQAGRTREAAKFFEPLYANDPEVGAVLAQALLDTDEEIKAVQVLYEALKRQPMSYGLLMVQIDFLKKKRKLDMALRLAKLAVVHAPSEFCTWAKLTEMYTEIGDYEAALLSLNACPMFTYCEKDAHRMPPPVRTHLPLRATGTNTKSDEDSKKGAGGSGSIYDENDPRENEVHPELRRLSFLSLRGTFSKAYHLLIRIAGKIGWEELLRHRSTVFVMEEEYRIHRALAEEQDKTEQLRITEEVTAPGAPLMTSMDEKGPEGDRPDDVEAPMEAISLDDDTRGRDRESSPQLSDDGRRHGLSIDELMKKTGAQTHSSGPSPENHTPNPRAPPHSVSFSFKNKRLCEKWLDNLFMVLYQDIRLYTLLKQEISQYKNQAGANANVLLYRKTGAEWEIYGDLAQRLDYKEDAKEAYRLCLSQKFSMKSWLKLLEMHSDEGNMQETLRAVAKLIAILDRAFIETTYPSPIATCLFKIISRHGLAKVQNALISLNLPQHEFRLITRFFEYAELFSVEGSKW